MGNPLAFAMIAVWPLVCLVLFDRLPAARALLWSIIGGYLLLPSVTAIPAPLFPDLDKVTGSAVGALLGMLFISRDGRPKWPEGKLARLLIALYIAVPLLSALANGAPMPIGPLSLPGISLYDGISSLLAAAIALLPMILAGSLPDAGDGPLRLMRALALAGLVYSFPMLLEIRLSPQLNVWIYGFFAHDFIQMIRYGGFRPMVFLTHGLWVALFAFTAVASSAAIARVQGYARRPLVMTAYLMAVLVLCKSAASILYGVALVPLILFASPRIQLRCAALIAAAVLSYPLLQWTELLPTENIIASVAEMDLDRSRSLEFRFNNERLLLEHAAESPWVGWSGWGRNMVFDPVTGEDISVADGAWIIILGVSGMLGFVAQFGLLVLPIFLGWRNARLQDNAPFASLALIHAATLIDLIPNATLTPLSWLTTGVLLAAVERPAEVRASDPGPLAAVRAKGQRPAPADSALPPEPVWRIGRPDPGHAGRWLLGGDQPRSRFSSRR
ncbi:MAG TPA: hypothetical protein PLL33_12295 [Paracoccus sp. (in: a-proteobacteria)]|nr:hypothetical protein [Paracoccus sp. (in: a-proteobacteria)]